MSYSTNYLTSKAPPPTCMIDARLSTLPSGARLRRARDAALSASSAAFCAFLFSSRRSISTFSMRRFITSYLFMYKGGGGGEGCKNVGLTF